MLMLLSVPFPVMFFLMVLQCQMTPRTEEPSHKGWQRLKLACPWFVHYDEQIMFLHVYWPFCQMVHQAFQDRSDWMNCLRDSMGRKKTLTRGADFKQLM